VAAAGLVAALLATLAGAGHDPSSVARANLRARRVLATPADTRGATEANASDGRDVTSESLVVYAPRLRRAAAATVPAPPAAVDAPPKTEAPKADAHPKDEDEDAVLDLGI
jgi:hypothetical protein